MLEHPVKMRLLVTLALITVLSGCKKSRFGWSDRLIEKPAKSELVGIYKLQKSDSEAAALIEMGYKDIDCSMDLRADGSYQAEKLPGCFIHGWDERFYPYTGGFYTISGSWEVVEDESVFDVRLSINSITEHTGLTISDPELAAEREPRSTLNVALVSGSPIDLGFLVFGSDFLPIRLSR